MWVKYIFCVICLGVSLYLCNIIKTVCSISRPTWFIYLCTIITIKYYGCSEILPPQAIKDIDYRPTFIFHLHLLLHRHRAPIQHGDIQRHCIISVSAHTPCFHDVQLHIDKVLTKESCEHAKSSIPPFILSPLCWPPDGEAANTILAFLVLRSEGSNSWPDFGTDHLTRKPATN